MAPMSASAQILLWITSGTNQTSKQEISSANVYFLGAYIGLLAHKEPYIDLDIDLYLFGSIGPNRGGLWKSAHFDRSGRFRHNFDRSEMYSEQTLSHCALFFLVFSTHIVRCFQKTSSKLVGLQDCLARSMTVSVRGIWLHMNLALQEYRL